MNHVTNTASLVDILQHWSVRSPDRSACRFLSFTDAPERGVTYQQLGARARAVGAALQARVQRGDRVILLYPPSLDFVTSFLGSFHAGAVAVPVYPPDPARPGRDLVKLRAIIADARPSLILSTTSIHQLALAAGAEARDLTELPWLMTDALEPELASQWRDPGLTSADIAFLQYTSGSTGQPKGVMVSHGNLLHNVQCIQQVFEDDESSTLVSWLPLYHDMGLIGNLLHGLYVGTSCLLMSPMDFLEQPLRWLETISQHRAHTSGAPNFAYELCVRKIAPAQRASLDLSSWRIAFNGAEPIRRATLERFSAAFAPHGFRREAFFPCYGLAEATLIVSGSGKALPPRFEHLQTAALERGQVELLPLPAAAEEPAAKAKAAADTGAGTKPEGRDFVGCGRVVPEHRIEIVDPVSRARTAPAAIGEIWVAGPSVAQGYWGKPEQTEQTFGATLSDDRAQGPFLRTGDLGFLRDGELFITGRLKDLIIVRGRNHYPQDLELSAEKAHPALRPGCGAAFTVEEGELERLVMVFEIDRKARATPIEEIAAAVSQRIAEQHELELHELVVIEAGRIPKTTSGKIQRTACRLGLRAGKLPVVATWSRPSLAATAVTPSSDATAPSPAAAPQVGEPAVAAWRAAPAAERLPRIAAWLREEAALVLELPPAQLTAGVSLVGLGLSSLRAVELRAQISRLTGASISFAELFGARDLHDLAALVAARESTTSAATAQPASITAAAATDALVPSFAQQRLWFLAQLEPDSADYNECLVLRLNGPLRRDLLEHALRTIVERHQVLRTSFPAGSDGPVIALHDAAEILPTGLRTFDVQGLPAEARDEEAMRLVRELAAAPFDLSAPPLLRAALVTIDAEQHLFALTLHHILCDARSAQIVCDELAALYAAGTGSPSTSSPVLPALPVQYGDLARREREQLGGAALEHLLGYWRQQLARMAPSISLPISPPLDRAAADTAGITAAAPRGRRVGFALSAEVSARLRALARREGVTPSAALLAGFFALLQRYSGQDDLPIGMPVSRRDLPEAAPLVGFFVNTLVMRGDLSGDPTFRELLVRTGATLIAGLEHQGLPFDLLVETLRPERRAGQSPLFNVMFSYEGAPMPAFRAGELHCAPISLDRGAARFDLTLAVADAAGGFTGALELDAARFDLATIERMARHLETLVAAAVAGPERRLSELPLVDEANGAAPALESPLLPWPPGPCAHELVAAHARRAPDAPAVVDGGVTLSYRQLDTRARTLARRLRDHGVGPDVIVGVCLPRSADLIVALLAVLHAGGAYLPLDPAHPQDRLRFLLEDAQVGVVLTTEALVDALAGASGRVVLSPPPGGLGSEPDLAPIEVTPARPEHLAYVIYTSGSTGTPKGVLLEHGSFAGYLATVRDEQALTPADRMLQFTAPTFDVAHQEIFGALTAGAALVLRGEHLHASIDDFLDACRAGQLTVVVLPTAFWAYLVTELAARGLALPTSLRLVFVGGEAMPPEALAAWQTLPARPALINAYGPTEATIAATYWTLPASATAVDRVPVDRVPIGAPLRGFTAYLLDPHGRPVPEGLAGELYLGGPSLARGYLRRPELTAACFVANPFGPGRLYRTGDLVRVLPDGNLVFLGRTDHQVKIRGFRIELGEVEAAVTSHPAVRDAVVLCLEHQGAPALIAYAVGHAAETNASADGAASGAPLDAAALRAFLKPRLPEPMIPARFLVLERWPLTSHGKIDRRALAALASTSANPEVSTDESAATAAAAPRTPIEELILGFYRELLGGERMSPGDDFFALGGHSLMAMRLLSRIRDALHVQLPLRALFEAPTAAALAGRVEAVLREGQASAPPLSAEPHGGAAPMSFSQQRLWFLDRLEPGGTLYNMTGGYRLRGGLDRPALDRALTALVARHEVLRTRLTTADGAPVQLVTPAAPFPLPALDLRELAPEVREAALAAAIDREAATPFVLATGPLLRALLIELAPEEHVLLLSMHHAISDGWSISVLLDDLAALYTAAVHDAAPALPALAIQYADYARWQRQWMGSDALETQLAYWKARLGGTLPVLQLPVSRRRPPVQTFRGASVDFAIPAALAGELALLGQRQGTTLFMTLMAAFQVLLRRYSGQDDILVGTPMAGRLRSETEALIGLFLNTVVIRSDLSKAPSFRELLGRVREATLEAWAHQDLPFERLVEELNPDRSLSHAPIFQVMFVLQNTPTPAGRLGDLALEPLPLRDRSAKFDLTLSVEEHQGQLRGSLQYNVDLFDAATIEHMAGHFLTLLASIVRAPDSIDISVDRLELATAEEREVLARINATEAPYPHDRCLDQLFLDTAARQPDATAVISGAHRLSYAALRGHSRRLGHRLRRMGTRGARPNQAIAVVMEKGWEQIVAMLGIHAAGSAYLPIDPGIPLDRLAYIVEHAQVEVVVTQPWIDRRLTWPAHVQRVVVEASPEAGAHAAGANHEDDAPLAPLHTPDDLAYILYTSGSTGRPKGVALGHRGAVNTVWDINARFKVTPADRVIAMSATTFDLSVYDVFGTLAAGAAIVIPEAASMRDPAHWAALVRDERVSIWSSVPAYIQMLLALAETQRSAQPSTDLSSLRVIALSGDVLPVGLPERIRAQLGPIEVANLGGNTEASIWSVTYPVSTIEPEWPSVPYGHPLANQRCYVLNQALVECPTSVPGDLYFAGLGLAREYWRDEAKTRECFFAHPETGERIYRTGDLAYWRADGELILLGRSDFQVKVQGFRIEPGEIEVALKKHPGVKEAIVVARDASAEGRPADKRLVAYVVGEPGAALQAQDLRAHLGELLPDYMIPSVFMMLADLPLSANGKIDRKALPAPDLTPSLAADSFVAPRTPLEHATAALWCEVLGVSRVGIHDNFFDLGGHSLLATQLIARLPAALGVELPLRTIFENPTIAEMGVAVAQQLASHKDDAHLATLLSELEGLSDAEAEDRLTHAPTSEG